MEAELEKDHEDDVIPVPSEGELDDDPELEALTKIAEETQERQIQVRDWFLCSKNKIK